MTDTKKTGGQESDPPSPPSWLDKTLIQRVLRNAGVEKPDVAAISVNSATAAGDNYGSTIYRVKVTLSDGEKRSFIVKGPALGAAMSNLTSESGVFQREAIMLLEVIPQMQALLEEAAPGRFPPLAPRCYLHDTAPVEFLVLEDLGLPGFKTADRRRGLGLRHCLLALRNLARFHAASYALLQRQPGLAERLPSTWRTMFDNMQVFVVGVFKAAAEVCRMWPGFEGHADHLDKFRLVAMDTFADLNEPRPGAFNVITHGDFWMSNMMFRYDGDLPKEHRAIDLQISHVASPATDLVYFIGSSLSDNVHEHHQDLLIREYYCELKETMELLGMQAPSLESLLSAVEVHGPLSMFLVMARPMMQAEHGVDMDALFSGNHSGLVPLYDLPKSRKWLQRVLPDCVRRGWLSPQVPSKGT